MPSTRRGAQSIGGLGLAVGLVLLVGSPVGAMIHSHASSSGAVASITVGTVTSSSRHLALTGVGKNLWWLALAGGILILIGASLLFLVDSPRRIIKRLAVLDLGLTTLGQRARSQRRRRNDGEKADVLGGAAGRIQPGAILYQGLAPGWYRDPSDRNFARYWDGHTVSRDSRIVIPINPDESSPFVLYQGLPSGWYRDEVDRNLARYWDGRRLSDERRSVAE
jgi:Protein of unknown function (DUF2510)